MKTCPRCAMSNRDDGAKCIECGEPLSVNSVAVPTQGTEPAKPDIVPPDPILTQQTFVPAEETAQPGQPASCTSCGAPAEVGYYMPLCKSCRDRLSRRPYPGGVIGSAIIILLMLGYSLSGFSSSLNAEIALERAHRAEKAAKYNQAVTEYHQVITKFPKSKETLARLAVAYYKQGDIRNAMDTIGSLRGYEDELSHETVAELNSIVEEVNRLVVKIQSERMSHQPQQYQLSQPQSQPGQQPQMFIGGRPVTPFEERALSDMERVQILNQQNQRMRSQPQLPQNQQNQPATQVEQQPAQQPQPAQQQPESVQPQSTEQQTQPAQQQMNGEVK